MRNLLVVLALLVFAGVVTAQTPEKFRVYLGTGKNIYHLVLDLKNGSMSKAQLAAELANPSFVAIHPNHKFLYSVSEINKGSIVAYSIDAKTGNLTLLNSQSAGGSRSEEHTSE